MADGDPQDPLPTPALSGEAWLEPDASEAPPQTESSDRYRRGGVLGSGGMGVVYSARDARLQRLVALKVAHDPALGRRMAREACITAQLDHPGIVPILDAGRDADGRPWTAMRLVRGRTLEERIREAADLEARLGLLRTMLAACEAVAFAHDRGVLHRDLKTANILVGAYGETLVADWGLARPTPAAEARWRPLLEGLDAPDVEGPDGVVGTPTTMSPEQARGERLDPRSDVFSLGAVLVELLTGRPARSGDTTLDQARRGELPGLDAIPPDAPADLVAVATKATRRDPAERYPDAAALARDLARLLDGRRVSAHHYTPAERLARWLRRWRVPLMVAAVAAVALGAMAGLSSVRNAQERDRAEQAEAQARAAFQSADANLGLALVQQALAAQERGARPEAELLAAHALLRGEDPVARGVLAAFGGSERPRRLGRWPLPERCTATGRLSPDGRRLLCTTLDELTVWSLATGEVAWSRPLDVAEAWWRTDGSVLARTRSNVLVRLGAEGHANARMPRPVGRDDTEGRTADEVLLAGRDTLLVGDLVTGTVASHPTCPSAAAALVPGPGPALRRCDDGLLRRYGADGREDGVWPVPGEAGWTAAARDGDRLVAGTSTGLLLVADLSVPGPEAWAAPVEGPWGTVLQTVPLLGTDTVVVLDERGGLYLWDLASSSTQGTLPGRARHAVAGPEPGQVVVLGDAIEAWQLPVRPQPWAVPVGAGVSSVDIAPDGERLVWAHGSGAVGVVALDPWREEALLRWQDGVVKGAAFTDTSDRLIASGMWSEGGRIFGARSGWAEQRVVRPRAGLTFRRVGGLKPGGVWGLTYSEGSALWDAATGELLLDLGGETFVDGASSPALTWAALLSADGGLWRLGPGPRLELVGRDEEAVGVDISEDGATVVVARPNAVCTHSATGRAPPVCHALRDRVRDVALSPAGDRVAVGTLAGAVRVLDLATGADVAVLRGHSARVSSVAWHPSGDRLVSGSWDGHVRVWDLSALDAPARELVETLEEAWGLALDDALRRD